MLEPPPAFSSELLLDYYQIRADERQEWSSSHARFKGAVADYERVVQVADFLDRRSLYQLDDLHAFLSNLENEYNKIRSEVKSAEKRMRDIDQIRSAVKTVRELQPVKDGWNKKISSLQRNDMPQSMLMN